MSEFDLYILGCGSALPTMRHLPSCQVISFAGKLYMVDCGEGCQLQMRRAGLNFNRLTHIFISHLHGDHCFGLPGLISTMGLLGRTRPLYIHGPKGLADFVQPILNQFCTENPFEVKICIHPTDMVQTIVDDRTIRVSTLPLQHRIPCAGFLFEEKCCPRHLIREQADHYQIPLRDRRAIAEGADYLTPEGEIIANHLLCRKGRSPRRYAYCSDTAYSEEVVQYIHGVDLLYHEATFLTDLSARAAATMHSTARQAASIAAQAEVKQLLIGHYSSRYDSEDLLLEEAKSAFVNTRLANEGMVIHL